MSKTGGPTPVNSLGAPCKGRTWRNTLSGLLPGHRVRPIGGHKTTFLRRAVAPRLLASLDSLVPPSLSDSRLKVGRYLGNILPLAHHAASHLVAIGIDC